MPAAYWNISDAICGVVPTPPVPKMILPGCALAMAITSDVVCAGNDGLTTSTSGEAPQ